MSNIVGGNIKGCPCNNLQAAVKLLQDKYHSTIRILADENNDLRAIFSKDGEMKRCFSNYPEIIFTDTTYKLLGTWMSCLLIIVEDGNGDTEIVAVSLFTTEGRDTPEWLLEVFKTLHSKWGSIRVNMADKVMKECHVAREFLPKSSCKSVHFTF